MLRIVFFGTPKLAVPFVKKLHEDGRFELVGIVTQPDAPQGRKQIHMTPPVAQYAKEQHIPLLQPERIKKNKQFSTELESVKADVFVVYAYGHILPNAILSLPRLGTINVHPSLLPAYRGPTPLQSAIRNGDSKTGISIMKIDEQMDHGPILAIQELSIGPNDAYTDIEMRVMEAGPTLLANTLAEYADGKIKPVEQNHEAASYCHLLTRSDGYLRPDEKLNAVRDKWRAYYPWPGITFQLENRKKYKVHEIGEIVSVTESIEKNNLPKLRIASRENQLFIENNEGSLEILKIQEEGRMPMNATDFIRGLPSQQIQESLKEMS